MDKDTESGVFVKEVAKYFMNFLETDFKKRRIPKRDTNKKTKSELTVWLDFEKYPKFKELLIKNLNTGFNKSELSAKKWEFVINIPENIFKFIDIKITEINDVTLNEFVSEILKVFADNKVLYNQQYDQLEENSILEVKNKLKDIFINPLLEELKKPLENLNLWDDDAIFQLEWEIVDYIFFDYESKIKDILLQYITKDNTFIENEVKDIFILDEIKEKLSNFFNNFSVKDLFAEIYEIHKNNNLIDKTELYLYFYEIGVWGDKFPLFYTPIVIERAENTIKIQFDKRLFVNTAGIEYIVQEYNRETKNLSTLNWNFERIIYLNAEENFQKKLNELLLSLEHFFWLSNQIDIEKPVLQKSVNSLVTISNKVYLYLFDKSDEALINDYEDILNLDGTLLDDFSDLLWKFVTTKEPISYISEVQDEWDNFDVQSKLIYESPIPLNDEQKQVINALDREDCKFLILEWPPWTGKSHTITSIICKALLEEKSVLVLSDKKEALDVVEDKISDTLNKVRFDENNFQNPILRIGKTGSRFNKLIQSQTISKIKEHARSFKTNRGSFDKFKTETKSSLYYDLSQNITHYTGISLKDIEAYFSNMDRFQDISWINDDNILYISSIEKDIYKIQEILRKLYSIKNLKYRYYWSSKSLKILIEEYISLANDAEKIKDRHAFFISIKDNIFYKTDSLDFHWIYSLYLAVQSDLERLENFKDYLPVIKKLGDITELRDLLETIISIDTEIFISWFTTINSKFTLKEIAQILEEFIVEYKIIYLDFTTNTQVANCDYEARKDLFWKIFDFSKYQKFIFELLPNFKLLKYSEFDESLEILDKYLTELLKLKNPILGFLFKKDKITLLGSELKNTYYSFDIDSPESKIDQIRWVYNLLKFIQKLLDTDKYSNFAYEEIFINLVNNYQLSNAKEDYDNLTTLIESQLHKKHEANYEKIKPFFNENISEEILQEWTEFLVKIQNTISEDSILTNNNLRMALDMLSSITYDDLDEFTDFFNDLIGKINACGNELLNLWDESKKIMVTELEIISDLYTVKDYLSKLNLVASKIRNETGWGLHMEIPEYLEFISNPYSTENHKLILDEILMLIGLDTDIKFLMEIQWNLPSFASMVNLDISNISLSEIDSPLIHVEKDFIADYISYKKLESKIKIQFNHLPKDNYHSLSNDLETIITTEMANFIDERLIDYVENNPQEVNTLKNIVSQKLKFPKDLFKNLKKAFPCIIAWIRDYADYIPLEKDLFDLIIIDEASQVSIAQALPAFIRWKKIVILWDDQQFSNVKSNNAKKEINNEYKSRLRQTFTDEFIQGEDTYGLLTKIDKNFDIKNSVLKFTRFIRNYEIQLKKHFRCYPEIISYSNKFFYNWSLQCMKIRGKAIEDVIKFDIIEHDGLLDLKANTNQLEVDFIISKLREFRESWIKQSVWIITPHTEQASLLNAKISSLEDHEYYFSDLKLKIMTFDTCQWEERDYIFYSMVASEAKDRLAWIFLKSFATQNEESEGTIRAQRMNVWFSRAKETIHFVLSQPLDKFAWEIGNALLHYKNELENWKKRIVWQTDINSPMETKIQHYFHETSFYKNNQDKIEFIPQFPIWEYIRQLDKHYKHPLFKVDFLLIYENQKIVIEYDGFKEHFTDRENVTQHNYEFYMKEDDIYRQKVLEWYWYQFLRINIFNIWRNPVETLNNRLENLVKKN